jgi:Domain of unknown function (DUF4868)
MIEQQIDLQTVAAQNFGVKMRSDASLHFIPTDVGTKAVLTDVLNATVGAFNGIDGDWQAYDISEDYGEPRRIFVARNAEHFGDVSAIFDIGALNDLANLDDHIRDIDYYFCEFRDAANAKIVGVKKAAQFKTTLAARNKLARLVNDTLQIIEENVVKIDPIFDALITDQHIFILKPRAIEYIADMVTRVAGAATEKVRHIHDNIVFLDLSRIEEKISSHPKMARMAASIAARDDLGEFQQEKIVALATQHGVVFKEVDGRLQCRVTDEAKLLEILDARRYHLDLANDGGDPYRASARQRVAN